MQTSENKFHSQINTSFWGWVKNDNKKVLTKTVFQKSQESSSLREYKIMSIKYSVLITKDFYFN